MEWQASLVEPRQKTSVSPALNNRLKAAEVSASSIELTDPEQQIRPNVKRLLLACRASAHGSPTVVADLPHVTPD